MYAHRALTIVSLLSLVLITLHITDDIVRGISPAQDVNMILVIVFAVWLLGATSLAKPSACGPCGRADRARQRRNVPDRGSLLLVGLVRHAE